MNGTYSSLVTTIHMCSAGPIDESAKRTPALVGFLVVLPPAFLLALGGVAKLVDPLPAADMISIAAGWRLSNALPFGMILGVSEFALALALCACVQTSKIPALIALMLYAAFAGVPYSVAQLNPKAATCGCFGSLSAKPIGRSLWLQIGIDCFSIGLLLLFLLTFDTRWRGASAPRSP